MKRIGISLAVVLLLFSMLFPYASANYLDKSRSELADELSERRAGLLSSSFTSEDRTAILETEYLSIYLNGDFYVESSWQGPQIILPVVLVNNSEMDVSVQTRYVSVNGFGTEAIFSPAVHAGKKEKAEITVSLRYTNVVEIEDFEDIELSFHISEGTSGVGKTVYDSDPVCIFADYTSGYYSLISDSELFSAYNEIRDEIESRDLTEENRKILADEEGIQIIVTGDFSVFTSSGGKQILELPVEIINHSEQDISLKIKYASINDWDCQSFFSFSGHIIKSHKMERAVVQFLLDDTDAVVLSDISEIEFQFYAIDYYNLSKEIFVAEPTVFTNIQDT
jgi:hypothetical protein